MKNYKVSIVIPCYNVTNIASEEENSFNLMINSILYQTFPQEDLEVLFVDDCSTDNTKSILEKLCDEHENFKTIFLKKNSGRPSIPRNTGIKNASSNYIMFLDQDDKMDEKCVETLYKEITEHNVDIVKSNYSILDGNKIMKYDSGKNTRLEIEPKSNDMIYLVSHFIWGSIYNKKFLIENEIEFPDTQAEDNLFLSKCYNLTQKDIIALNDYYSIIYTSNNENSLGHSFTLKQIIDYVNIFEITMDSYIKHEQSPEYIKITIERYIMILIGSLLRSKASNNDKKEMVKYVKKFLDKYDEYDINLAPYWKIFITLIKNEQTGLILLLSKSIQVTFENNIFKKIFRNNNYN